MSLNSRRQPAADLHLDPDKKIRELSIGEQQRVEIIKVIYRGAKILILDEPTAVLTPQESEALYKIIRRLADQNHSIIFISHKMKEVLDLSHRITVLHRGKSMGTYLNQDLSAEILSNLMLGKKMHPSKNETPNEFSNDVIAKKISSEEKISRNLGTSRAI